MTMIDEAIERGRRVAARLREAVDSRDWGMSNECSTPDFLSAMVVTFLVLAVICQMAIVICQMAKMLSH